MKVEAQSELSSYSENGTGPVLIYDGECKFCNGIVDLVMKHEKNESISFMWLQDTRAASLIERNGLDPQADSIFFIHMNKGYQYSSAALEVTKFMKWPWNWWPAFYIVPKGIRDSVYRFIAKHRKKIMGSTSCALPIGQEHRFV